MKRDSSNVAQATRNEVLAKLIDNGCQNLEHLKAVAKTAQLDEQVTLDSDKSVEEYKKWWFFKEHKLVVTPKTPLERARSKSNQDVMNMLQELTTQKK